MKSNIFFTILIMIMLAGNALAQESCGATTSTTGSWGSAWSLEAVAAAYEAITDVATYASTTTALSNSWDVLEIGDPECIQYQGQTIRDFNMKYQVIFDSATPDYEKVFFNENTEIITMVAAFNGDPGSVNIVSLDFNTKEFVFKNNYAWDGDITFTGATYDENTGYTTISANTVDGVTDVQIIFTVDSDGNEVYTTQIEITGENMKSGCIELVNGNLVTCTLVNSYNGVTTINPANGVAISTVVIPITVKPMPDVKPYGTIDSIFEQPTADAGDDDLTLGKCAIAPNGGITPTASKYTSPDATWDSVAGIEILSEGITAVYGITSDGLTFYPTVTVYDTDINEQIFGYRIQKENAVIAGVAATADGDIVVAATDELAAETSLYHFNSAGVLQNSGKESDFSAYTIDVFIVQPGGTAVLIGGKKIANKPKLVLVDLEDFSIEKVISQDVTASYDEVVNALGFEAAATMKGSFGMQIYGITPPPAPEFSLTTLLLATLLAGGLVLFVIRRRYK